MSGSDRCGVHGIARCTICLPAEDWCGSHYCTRTSRDCARHRREHYEYLYGAGDEAMTTVETMRVSLGDSLPAAYRAWCDSLDRP